MYKIFFLKDFTLPKQNINEYFRNSIEIPWFF